jgi:hypothetical protein
MPAVLRHDAAQRVAGMTDDESKTKPWLRALERWVVPTLHLIVVCGWIGFWAISDDATYMVLAYCAMGLVALQSVVVRLNSLIEATHLSVLQREAQATYLREGVFQVVSPPMQIEAERPMAGFVAPKGGA